MADVIRVVTDEAGQRWVQAADVPEVRKLALKALRVLCPDVAHFDDGGRPVRWIPVDQTAALLVQRGEARDVAEARQASYAAAPLTATGLRRHGLAKLPEPPAGEGRVVVQKAPVAAPTAAPAAGPAPPALVPRMVDGWTLFDGGGGTWVRDIDLAERAGSPQPRDIRPVIATAIKQGALTEIGAGAVRANGTPGYRTEVEVVVSGKGRQDQTTVYYLNQEGALLVLTRLRTPKAIEATKAVVVVFARAMRGELVAAPPPHAPPPALHDPRLDRILDVMEEQGRATAALLGLVGTLVKRLEGPGTAQSTAPQPAATAPPAQPKAAAQPPPPTVLIPRDWRSSDVIAALLTERRGHRVSKSKVDAAIAALKLRERPELARHGMTPRTDGGGVHYEVPYWRYAPAVVDLIERHLFTKPAAQQTIPGAD